MAWYSDEEYQLRQEIKDKKSTAASAFKQRSHCGKGGRVRLPSDNLSKKELKKMSGECVSYRLNEPMNWEKFKDLPDDLKVNYIKSIRDRFGVTDKAIAEMFGISHVTLSRFFKCLKLNKGSAKGATYNKDEFYTWMNGVEESTVKEEEPGTYITDTEIATKERESYDTAMPNDPVTNIAAIPYSGKFDFMQQDIDSIIQTLQALKVIFQDTKLDVTFNWSTRPF